MGSSIFSKHPFLIAHAIQLGRCQYRGTVRWSFVSRVPKIAHATALNTARNTIDQLVWEPCHNYTMPCQGCSTRVGKHHSCHMQVSSNLQQCMEDDLLLVAIDAQHHGSHHKTVLEEKLSQDQCEKDPNFCLLPSGNSSKIGFLWKQGVSLLVFLLRVLEASQHSSGLCLEEAALFIPLDGEPPIVRHIIFRFNLPHVNEIKNFIIITGFVFKMLCFSNLVLPELMFVFAHEISSWLLLLLLFRRWPYSVPTCLLFDCPLLLELQPLCCRSRWSHH